MTRGLLCAGVVFTTLLTADRPGAQNAAPAARQQAELPETWLEGTIGGRAVRVFLETAGWPKTEGLWGVYYYTNDRFPIVLDGEWLPNGMIRMYEGEPSNNRGQHARLDLQLGATVTGTRASADGGRRLPVRLRRTKRPAPFETAIRNPRRFADPGWPMQLTYPAGWFLGVAGTQLTLRSPDPQDVMFDNTLACERGHGLPRVPRTNEAAVEFKGAFYRTHDGWRIAAHPSGECDGKSCVVPKTRQVGTMTLMSGDTAFRSHNAWGYAGIGEATEYLVVDGEEWAHCVDRLLDSDSRIGPRKASPRSLRR